MADIDNTLEDWKRRVDEKTKKVEDGLDQGLLQASYFALQKALANAQERIYSQPIPKYKNGNDMYKRTGLYKGNMSNGMSPDKKHSSMIYNTVPYAKSLEYGNSRGMRGKNIMGDAVFKNGEDILKIIKEQIANSTK